MSVRTRPVAWMRCDGCDRRYPTPGRTAAEVRARAAVGGWTFPLKVLADGRPSRWVSDVCPDCAPRWRPRLAIVPRAEAAPR